MTKPKLTIYGPISLCPHCHAEAVQRWSGDEGWTFCSDGCGCLEGDTTIESYSSDLSDHHTAEDLEALESQYELVYK